MKDLNEKIEVLLEVLKPCLTKDRHDRYQTLYGQKTIEGLKQTIIRILTDDEIDDEEIRI